MEVSQGVQVAETNIVDLAEVLEPFIRLMNVAARDLVDTKMTYCRINTGRQLLCLANDDLRRLSIAYSLNHCSAKV